MLTALLSGCALLFLHYFCFLINFYSFGSNAQVLRTTLEREFQFGTSRMERPFVLYHLHIGQRVLYIYLYIIIIKKGRQCKAERE